MEKIIKNPKLELKDKIKKKCPKLEKSLKINLFSKIGCLSSLNDEQNLIVGYKSGEIKIFAFTKEDSIKPIQEIKEFTNEIKLLCELDTNLFAATDGKTQIKIIELNNKEYKVIRALDLPEDSEMIYTMINLPILSHRKNRHFFCTGDKNHILVWSSNKKPKKINIQNEEINTIIESDNEEEDIDTEDSFNHDEPLDFTLEKDIKLCTLTQCLIEVDGNYLAAACTKKGCIKFFNVQKNFKEEREIENKSISSGNNILTLSPKKQKLIVGCKKGFSVININNYKKSDYYSQDMMITSLEWATKDYYICCCSKKEEKQIKKYSIEESSSKPFKYNEKSLHKNEVWNFKIIRNKVFYTFENYLKIIE